MKVISIRMSEAMWEAVQDEAARQGISASELMRNSTLSAMAYLAGQRGDAPYGEELRRFGLRADR